MNNNIEVFKKLMKNKRYKALFKLGLFILFFITIFLVFDLGQGEKYLNENQLQSNKNSLYELNNYSFSYIVKNANIYNELSTSLTINGYRNKEKYVFEVLEHNSKYYYEDKLYTYNTEIVPYMGESFIDIKLYNPENIKKYIDKSNLDSTTTYSDGKVKKIYKIDVVTFSSFINDNVITTDKDITITIYENNGELESVELDLLNYNKSNIMISYHNINNIVDFNKESLLK